MNDELLDLLLALDGVAQDPRYHPEGDALFHSLQVFAHARRATDDPVLVCAALLHDVGKALGSPAHDVEGAELLDGLVHPRAGALLSQAHRELTVYERQALRERPRSSTDGKPIVRVKPDALEALLRAEHADAWERLAQTGVLEGIDEDDDEDDAVHDHGSWDGLLDEEPPDPESLPTAEELAGDAEDYDPLPGFEDA